jgi:mannose/fructose/N-acetylgalactosamine-specific phosphotransferase system component IID
MCVCVCMCVFLCMHMSVFSQTVASSVRLNVYRKIIQGNDKEIKIQCLLDYLCPVLCFISQSFPLLPTYSQ